MRRFFVTALVLLFVIVSHGHEPSGTLPVLYVNTVNSTPVDQRQYYVEATAWLDASMTDKYESVGSESKPLRLGIRGRGNSSWWSVEKKPYKLKFTDDVSLLGMTASQHFALLHWLGSTTAYFREPIGYEAARRLGDAWVPSVDALEVVLNGDYIGLYFLSETVRVEPGRVNIARQPDCVDNEDLVRSGWLVEIDNYDDENQSVLYEPDGRELKLTYKSPELLSEAQKNYIESEFTEIIRRVHDRLPASDDWLEIVDGESMARYYIVTELLQNKDGCNGSFYWHKSADSRWIAGPLWDLSYSLERPAEDTYLHTLPLSSNPKLIRAMLDNSGFREIIKDVWQPFYEEGAEWVDRVAYEWIEKMKVAAVTDKERWTFGHSDVHYAGRIAASIMKQNIEWFNGYLQSAQFNRWDSSGIVRGGVDDDAAGPVFDLMGRRVLHPAKGGVYVRDGRKFVSRGQ